MIWQKKVYIPLIAVILIVVTSIIFFGTHHHNKPAEITVTSNSSSVVITNKSQYVDELAGFPDNLFQHDITVLVRTYKKSSPPSISTMIRDGSLTKSATNTANLTDFIIDIPKQKLSFSISWIRVKSDPTITLSVSCLEKDKLIYGDFGCHDTSLL